MISFQKNETKNNSEKNIFFYFIAIGPLYILTIIIFFKLNNLKLFGIVNQNINNNGTNKRNKLTLSDKLKILKLYTNNNELRYKNFEKCLIDPDGQKCIYHYIVPKNIVGKKRILLGNKNEGDGVYVIADDFKDIKIAYSFGIATVIQFDKALADRGIDVFMYDHTISNLPYENPRFHWFKIGLSGKAQHNNDLKDLDTLIQENKHISEKNMILKLDIEHWEWPAINDLDEKTLSQFKYILIEYHFKNGDSSECDMYYDVIKKIAKTHQSFYARCNGSRSLIFQFGNNRICPILEVSYIIRENNKFIYDDTIYPIEEFEYIPKTLDGKLEMNLNLLKLFDSDI